MRNFLMRQILTGRDKLTYLPTVSLLAMNGSRKCKLEHVKYSKGQRDFVNSKGILITMSCPAIINLNYVKIALIGVAKSYNK